MRKTMLGLSGLLLALSSFSFSHAQQGDEPPLMIHLTMPDAGIAQSDLYRYTADQGEPVTSGGYKGGFSLSPDGTQIAYQIAPSFLQELIQEHGAGHLSAAAWDITLLDLASGELREIATQPTNVQIDDDNQNFANGINRSRPVWSPDGNALAWTEQDYPEQDSVARFVMADIATGEIRVLDDALPQMTLSADRLPSSLSWGEPGIAVFTNDPIDNQESIRLYDPVAGTMQVVRDSDEYNEWMPLSNLLWVEDEDSEVLVVEGGEFNWLRIDPNSGAATSLSNRMEFGSAANPDSSLRLLWDIFAVPEVPEWQLLAPDGTLLESWGHEMEMAQFAMPPSEQAIAYLQDNEVHLWQDGTDKTLPLPDGLIANELFWGHMSVQFGAEFDSVG